MIHHTDENDITMEFFQYAREMMHGSRMNEDTRITPENVYQKAHMKNRDTLFKVLKKAHLPGSTILGTENVLKLYDLAKQGKSCLILSEHVSNLDVPSMFTRFYDHENPKMKEIFEDFIFIAGTKLNQTPLVKLFTEMFTRVVIFAIRSLDKIKSDETKKEEAELAKKINIRSTRIIGELRNKGHIFVLYPSGTRYRPWNPVTKKGLPMTFSYINSFDYFICSSINGNNMPPKEHEDMTREPIYKDVLVFNFGKVQNTKEYVASKLALNKEIKADTVEGKEQTKKYIVDCIMDDIDRLHEDAEEYRSKQEV
ncbi:MAG: 1-acyl-sn-glycerol-3-phosphate acyltransferase [Spirochaetes bacterium]|nr:1-acyl-sn-glycerol-3-phosphate acyltransferase [Spirochaetota bacterium]